MALAEVHSRGALTLGRALYLVSLAFLVGVFIGVLGWFTVFRPLRSRLELAAKRRTESRSGQD